MAQNPDQPLWTGTAATQALHARTVGSIPPAIHGISIDSRSLSPGDLFFAIKDKTDGHDYVPSAFAAGAVAAVVDEAHAPSLVDHGPLYIVDNVLLAMERLASAARLRTQARIIAVTGSVGKTSTSFVG